MENLLDLVTGGRIPLIAQILDPFLYPDSLSGEMAVIPTKKVGCIYSPLESGLIQWKKAEGRVCHFERSLREGLHDCAGAPYLRLAQLDGCSQPPVTSASRAQAGR